MIFDLLDNPKTASLIRQVVVSLPDFEERADYRIKLEDAPSKLHDNDKQNLLIQLATPQVFQSCCDTMTPQGIVAIVDIPSCEEVEEKSSNESTAKSSAALHLVLDGVSDPGNVGTLLRSSLAVGVKSVMLLPGCCDVWNPKAVRSGMGASFQLPLFSCDDWENGMTVMDKLGVKAIYVATMLDDVDDFNASAATHHGANPKGSVAYHQVDWSKENSALVIGSEGNGLSHQVRQALMTKAINGENGIPIKATHIPMEAGIESLNAAVCGSVILFEYARQQAKTQSE